MFPNKNTHHVTQTQFGTLIFNQFKKKKDKQTNNDRLNTTQKTLLLQLQLPDDSFLIVLCIWHSKQLQLYFHCYPLLSLYWKQYFIINSEFIISSLNFKVNIRVRFTWFVVRSSKNHLQLRLEVKLNLYLVINSRFFMTHNNSQSTTSTITSNSCCTLCCPTYNKSWA